MKSLIKRSLWALARVTFERLIGQFTRSQEVQVLLVQQYKDLVRRSIKPLPTFDEVGFRCHSQYEEDGILLYIFALIGTTNKIAVEMCAGHGIVCNTTNLIVNHGWQGLLFDGSSQNVETGRQFFSQHPDTRLWPPQFVNAWITAENVNSIVQKEGISGKIDLLSLDMDGMDYWIWKALDCIEPRVVVCEAHNVIGPDKAITVPYDPNFKIQIPDYCGASLAAMNKLAAQKGYRLVGAHRYGFNAFFVRNGIGEDLFPPAPVATCFMHPRCTTRHEGEVAKG